MGATHHRMFHVIVLGGVALVDCGARTELGRPQTVDDASKPVADAADEDAIGFPEETALSLDASMTDVVEEIVFPPPEAMSTPPPDSGKR
jgi:hypothetical protein